MVALVALFAPAVRKTVYAPKGPGDFQWHGESAERLLHTGRIETAHPAYPVLLAGLGLVLERAPGISWSWTGAAIALAIVFQCLAGIVLTRAARERLESRSATVGFVVAALLAIALLLATPITLLSMPRHNLYLGYIGINVYHNPTMFLLKPLAAWSWLRLAELIGGPRPVGAKRRVGLALGMAASTLAKPSYAIALLPALTVFAAWKAAYGRRDLLAPLAFTVVLPAVLLLGLQFAFFYGIEGSRLQWAPLLVMGGHPLERAVRLALSAAFPAVVASVYWNQARRSEPLVLAWLVFGVGAALSYFVAEEGRRAYHGNLLWSGQAALFILFVASALFLLEQRRGRPALDARAAVAFAVFAVHVACGVVFLVHPLWW